MNRYCKTNKISIHGYYIAYSLINLFTKIKKKLLKKEKISYKDLNHFWLALSNNIDYLNSRVDETNIYKTKINNNYCKSDKSDKSNKSNKSDKSDSSESNTNNTNNTNILEQIYCNHKCYICWVDKVLSNFFYILLITAKFIGSGDTKDPNLFKLSEYNKNDPFT